MKKNLEKLSPLKFKALDKNELRQIGGGLAQSSNPCPATSHNYNTYVTPTGDYTTTSDGGAGTDCYIA